MDIKKLTNAGRRAASAGFTMVELAIVLVVAGLILVAVLKGTDTINKAKVERAVADLKGLQGMVLETKKRINRLPGDCDIDGTIELYPPDANTYLSAANTLNAVNRDPGVNSVCGAPQASSSVDETAAANVTTAGTGGAAGDTANLVYSEMRRAGVVDGHRTNLELAKHNNQDAYLIGSMQSGTGTSLMKANVIVMYGIPVWLAEAIDAEIDGAAQDYGTATATGGPACNGRVRAWQGRVTVTAVTSAVFGACTLGQYNNNGTSALNRDDLVSISYQFDTIKLPN